MIEQSRGCGMRKMGAMYLEGTGLTVGCDRLPFNIEKCPICDQGINFTRGFTWIHWYKYAGTHENCKDQHVCPICHPEDTREVITEDKDGKQNAKLVPVKYGLMWVGKKYYTPDSFTSEAMRMGISKRIATLPYNIEMGKTWILLAHQNAGERPSVDPDTDEPIFENCSAVFYAFRPTRVVKIINSKEARDEKLVANLVKRGITPLVGLTDGKGNVSETFTLDEWKQRNTLGNKVKRLFS